MIREIVIGIADPAVIDPSCAAVPSIRSALHVEQNRSAAFDAEFRRGRLLDTQFFDGLRRKRHRGNSENTCLIDR